MPAGGDDEFLPLVALGIAELRVEVAQGEPAEGDVPRLVLHHIGVDRGRQGVLRLIADPLKRGQCQTLDQDLHRQIGHVPAAVGQPVLEQGLHTRGDRVGELEFFVQQPRIGFDVARLIHHLGRGIEFRVEIRHGLHDLGGRDQRALLAMNELGYLRRLQVMANLTPLLLVHPVPDVGAEDVDDPVVEHHRVLRIEVERPVDPFGRVPLLLLALGIELQQGLARLVVFPGEAGLGIAVELPLGLFDREHITVGRRHREFLRRIAR